MDGQARTDEAATYRKIAWRIVPLLFFGYFVSFIDRVNVGFAKLQMAGDLAFSDAVYGFGAGIFFIGYALFELPSNLILHKVGARRWIARIAFTWSLASAAFTFTDAIAWGPVSAAFGCTDAEFTFYVLRFLLGVAEAGLVPGVLLYLTSWFPAARLAHMIALFFIAIPLANALGAPLSGAILQFLDGFHGLRGWQWLFLIEAAPSFLFCLLVLFALPDGPHSVRWLGDAERATIARQLAEDHRRRDDHGHRSSLAEIFSDWRVWALALADFSRGVVSNAMTFWMPTIIQEMGIDKQDYLAVGLFSMVPWGLAGVVMLVWARSSDRSGERRWHLVLAMAMALAGLLLLALGGQGQGLGLSIAALTLVAAGSMAWLAVFWTLPTKFLSGTAAAGGIAWINSLAMLSGYVGPDTIGRLRGGGDGDGTVVFLFLAAFALLCVLLSLVVARPKRAAG
jgi:MFS family permease